MSADESVSQWLGQLQDGDRNAAAKKLWERYFERLVVLARKKLKGSPRRVADEEDVALSAFNCFCNGVEGSRFPQLDDRDNLWRLLATITSRKAFQLGARVRTQKRGGNAVLDEAALAGPPGGNSPDAALDQFVDREPSPEFVAQMAEECRRLLDLLKDDELKSVAQWKMEGYTNEEIAKKLDCAPRTVERKLSMIRGRWEKENES